MTPEELETAAEVFDEAGAAFEDYLKTAEGQKALGHVNPGYWQVESLRDLEFVVDDRYENESAHVTMPREFLFQRDDWLAHTAVRAEAERVAEAEREAKRKRDRARQIETEERALLARLQDKYRKD